MSTPNYSTADAFAAVELLDEVRTKKGEEVVIFNAQEWEVIREIVSRDPDTLSALIHTGINYLPLTIEAK